jgi:hypothetical protein
MFFVGKEKITLILGTHLINIICKFFNITTMSSHSGSRGEVDLEQTFEQYKDIIHNLHLVDLQSVQGNQWQICSRRDLDRRWWQSRYSMPCDMPGSAGIDGE